MLRALVASIALLALPAFAGEPLATEDASILPKGACQLESWYRHERDIDALWALPACSPNDYVELALGGAVYRDDEAGRHALLQLQAKPMLYRDPGERFALAAVLAALRDTGRGHSGSGFHGALAALIASFQFLDSSLRVHVNGGIGYSHREFTTGVWGTALEYDVVERLTLMGEVFRDSPGRANFQLGVRYTVIDDRFEVFASGGDRFGGDGAFIKAGIRLQADLLP